MAYRKTKATEERKEARRRLILDAATKLFGKHGYHAATVPMVVEEAGISTGSFYMYFRNKEYVFNAALEELGQAITKVMAELVTSQPDPVKQIPQAVETIFLFLAQNPQQARILLVESSGLSPRLDKTRRAILLQQQDQVKRTLESAPSIVAVDDVTIAARCIVGAVFESIYCWLEENPKSRMPVQDVARAVARFNLQAVIKQSAKPKHH